ncbi:MAG: hypothetical protein HY791_18315 [Deltaproteobacteria bacterium]|nr:hypothetical protein [Deltaproteobacteria bacterium]
MKPGSMRRSAILFFGTVLACDAPAIHALAPESAKSALLVTGASGRLRLRALPIVDGFASTPIELDPPVELSVLFYAESLDELMIAEGEHVDVADPSRPIPRFDSAVVGMYTTGEAVVFRPLEDAAQLESLRVPALNAALCARTNGCFEQSRANLVCHRPCSEPPQPLAPKEATQPAPPEPLRLLPCPTGWTEVSADSRTFCEPRTVAERLPCADDEAHFLGDLGCAPIGEACPPGEFRDDLPTDKPIVYVSNNGSAEGDGSIDAPVRTLAEALALATPGSVVALGKGTFEASLGLSEPMELIGACVGETTVTAASGASLTSTLRVLSPEVSVANLRVTGLRRGVSVGPAGEGHLRGVLIEGTTEFGWLAESGGRAFGEEVVVRGVAGRAIEGRLAGELEGRRVSVEDVTGVGIQIRDPSTRARFEDLVVLRTVTTTSAPREGHGVIAQANAELVLRNTLVESTTGLAISVYGATATISDTVARRTQPWVDGAEGTGLRVAEGARVRLDRVLVTDTPYFGVDFRDLGTRVRAADLVVERTTRDARGSGGLGLYSAAERIDLSRVRIDSTQDRAFVLRGGTAHVEDLLVREAASGVVIERAAELEMERVVLVDSPSGLELFSSSTATVADFVAHSRAFAVRVDDSRLKLTRAALRGSGANVYGPDASVSFADVFVSGSQSNGVTGSEGARLEVRRLLAERVAGAGVTMDESVGDFMLEDITVRQPSRGPGGDARGVRLDAIRATLSRIHLEDTEIEFRDDSLLQEPSRVSDLIVVRGAAGFVNRSKVVLDRARILDSSGEAILIEDTATLTATNLEIRNAITTTTAAGVGVRAIGSGAATLARFVVDGCEASGLELDGSQLHSIAAPTFAASDGAVTGSPTGFVVKALPEFDLGDVLAGVKYQFTRAPFEVR